MGEIAAPAAGNTHLSRRNRAVIHQGHAATPPGCEQGAAQSGSPGPEDDNVMMLHARAVPEGGGPVQGGSSGYFLCGRNLVAKKKCSAHGCARRSEEKEDGMDYFWFLTGLAMTIAVIGFIKCSSLED
jgi:hypothetical protein